MKFTLNILILGGALMLLSGCAGGRVVYVQHEAPPARVEIIGDAPYRGAMWVKGHWDWRRKGYVWIPGHWRRI